MNRPTELENIKVHATSVDSLGSRYKDGPNVVVSQLESEYVVIDRQQSSLKHSEYESSLNASPQQQEASEEAVVAKESLANWGVLACVFLSNFIAAIDLTGFGVFYPFLVEHFDATTAAVGWCSSINGFFQSVVGKSRYCSVKQPYIKETSILAKVCKEARKSNILHTHFIICNEILNGDHMTHVRTLCHRGEKLTNFLQ
jgi:hypothetical protein